MKALVAVSLASLVCGSAMALGPAKVQSSGKCVGAEINGICERHPEIVKKILDIVGKSNCSDVNKIDLCQVEELMLAYPWQDFDKGHKYPVKKIKKTDLEGLTKLRHLSFEFAGLEMIEPDAFSALVRDQADDCYPYGASARAKAIKEGKSQLGEAYFSYPQDVSTAPCLQVLDLSHNHMKSVDESLLRPLTRLVSFEMDSNYNNESETTEPTLNLVDGRLPDLFFDGLTELEEVDMDEIGIRYIQRELFSSNSKLKTLDIEGGGYPTNKIVNGKVTKEVSPINRIATVEEGALDVLNQNAGTVEIGGNPIAKDEKAMTRLKSQYSRIEFK